MENMTKTRDVRAVEKAVASDQSLADNYGEVAIRDIMSRDVITATSSDTILSVAAKMSENNISCVVVVDEGHVTGIITQKDVLQAVADEDPNFHLEKVSQRMSSPVEAIFVGQSVIQASKIMEAKGIRRLPVVQGRKLVGIVTQTDLTRGLISLTSLRHVADIMSRTIATIDAEATVAEAARIMSRDKVSCIVARYRERLAGILTERDLLKRVVARSKNPAQTQVADVMSCSVVTVSPTYSIVSAGNKMQKMHVHRLVIVDGKKICGIVTQTDIIRAVRSDLEGREEERQKQLLVRRCPECAAPLRPPHRQRLSILDDTMKKRHVKVLNYSVIPGSTVDYDKAAPITEDTDSFTVSVKGGIASFEMKEQYATIKEARQIVDPYIRTWEVLSGLGQAPDDLNFDFQDAEFSDNSAPEADSDVDTLTAMIIAHTQASGTLHVSRGKYPAPPKCFVISPDVETMYNRYKGYREGREPLPSMAHMCLTVFQASAGGRAKAEKRYCIDRGILGKIGELSSQKGNATRARKVVKGGNLEALTTSEKKWLNEAVKVLIRRAGEWAYDPNAQLTQITMNDLPAL